MIEGLTELWADVQRLDRPVASHRNPGVDRQAVESVFGEPVPDEVADWFAWSDGVAYYGGQTQADASLVPGYYPLSAKESAAIRSYHPYEPILLAKWYPLLGTGGGDFYAACFDPASGRSYVVSAMIGEDTDVAFKGIAQMVEVFHSCYQDGVFFVDDDGDLDADYDEWAVREEQAVADL